MTRVSKKNLKKYFVETRYLGEKIDLKRLQDNVKKYRYLTRDHPIVLQLLEDEYAVITKFGTVTFWNVNSGLARQFLKEILPFVTSRREVYEYADTMNVYIGGEKEDISSNETFLKELDVEKIKIISYVSAQSVALDRYEDEIDERLEELGKVVANIKNTGKTHFRQKDLLKQVGHVLFVKQHTVANLALFDKPDETWDREELEHLYDVLRAEYDLRDRFNVLNQKIDFLSENNTTLLEFISSQRGNFLELIIIILIVIEILLFLPEWLPFFVGLFK